MSMNNEIIDYGIFNVLKSFGDDFLKELLNDYVNDSKLILENIKNSNDLEFIKKEYHGLKGISYTIGLKKFPELCHDIKNLDDSEVKSYYNQMYSCYIESVEKLSKEI